MVACIFVVADHTNFWSVFGTEWSLPYILAMGWLGDLAVPVFFVLSFYLFAEKNQNNLTRPGILMKARWEKLLPPYLFWSFATVGVICLNPFMTAESRQAQFQGAIWGVQQFWFTFELILFVPVIAHVVRWSTKTNVALFITSIPVMLLSRWICHLMGADNVLNPLLVLPYPFAGVLLSRVRIEKQTRVGFALVLSGVACAIWECVECLLYPRWFTPHVGTWETGGPFYWNYGRVSLLLIASGLTLSLASVTKPAPAVIRELAPLCNGIYNIHVIIIILVLAVFYPPVFIQLPLSFLISATAVWFLLRKPNLVVGGG